MTKIFVSTKETQGQRKNDFSFVPEGEMLLMSFTCCNSSKCGCGRSLVGVSCRKGTTTFKVVEVEKTSEELMAELKQAWAASGWPTQDKGLAAAMNDLDTYLLNSANLFAAGTIVEYDKRFKARTPDKKQ